MLFNSYTFIFLYFPAVLLGFFLIGARHRGAAAGFLAVASLFFYGWAGVQLLPLLVGSILFNYWAGLRLTPLIGRSDDYRKARSIPPMLGAYRTRSNAVASGVLTLSGATAPAGCWVGVRSMLRLTKNLT